MKQLLKYIVLGLFIFPNIVLNAQNASFEWVKKVGSSGNEQGRTITTDLNGDIYVAGFFVYSVFINSSIGQLNLTSNGHEDIFIKKLDSIGNLLWIKQIGGTGYDVITEITTDLEGNVYATGWFQNTVDFDPGIGVTNLTSNGSLDIFILKLDSLGNFLWVKQMGGIGADLSYSIKVDNLGNIFTTGTFMNTVDFDPDSGVTNLTFNGIPNVYIHKLDSVGKFQWVKQIEDTVVSNSITVDNLGGVYVKGSFRDIVDFDPNTGVTNLTSNGSLDIFILKLNTAGSFLWVNQIGGTGFDEGNSITIDKDGYVYSTGLFAETVDFNPGVGVLNLTSNGLSDMYIQKLDSNGNLVWAKHVGSSSFVLGVYITTDIFGSVYTTGAFGDTADFNPGIGNKNLISNGDVDIFILKLNKDGNFEWAKQMGGTWWDIGLSITLDLYGNIYTTGHFSTTVDFNPDTGIANLTSSGGLDIFILKLSQCLIDTSLNQRNDSLIAMQNGAIYQWLDCDSNFRVINGATNQIYKPVVSGNYACEILINGCADTTSCISFILTGLSETLNQKDIKIYPNPVGEYLSVELEQFTQNTNISIHNIKGQLMYENSNLSEEKIQINVSNWIKGIYLVKIVGKDYNTSVKIVIN